MQVWKGMDAFFLLIALVSYDLHVKDNDLSYHLAADSKQNIEE